MGAPTDDGLRTRSVAGPAAVLAGVSVAWLAVAALRPGDTGPTPCPWRLLTGLDCPFCGATRAAASLASGDLVTALDHNALFVMVILPLAVLAWGIWAARSWRGQPAPVIANRTVLILMAVTTGWWVLRLAVPWLGSTAG
ncbi:MAG TPA: DUF2752 domain-containing protein [Motilibacterales bacterium]|nr:DUF2752 domain-containing protein [Motilibacterales bacterium]